MYESKIAILEQTIVDLNEELYEYKSGNVG